MPSPRLARTAKLALALASLGVAGLARAQSTSVRWTVEPAGCGSVDSTGLFTAPPSAATCVVRATSAANASVSGTASVTVATAPVTCTSFTYSAWSACTGGLQTRTVVSASPAGCTGGSPVLSQACGEVRAFPGAEGFGARATGGRGGRVIKVTNLNASGAGSLQAALDVNQPRIIVFAVSGVIRGDVTVTYGNVTIAGQTAPGGGITIAGRLYGEYDASVQNIIIRHVRVRPPRCSGSCNADQYDAMQFSRNSRLILDHISVAYGADETIDTYDARDVTVQWTTVEPSQIAPQHSDGSTHNYGMLNVAGRVSYLNNLCAGHRNRCPALSGGPSEMRNSVAYNVRHAFVHHSTASGNHNLVGNYFKDGPSGSLYPFYFDSDDGSPAPRYYVNDSFMDDPPAGVNRRIDNIWADHYWGTLERDSTTYRATSPFDFSVYPSWVPVTQLSSTAAYASVLDRAGAFPRDGFTRQVITDVRNRTGAWNPDLPADLMAGLAPTTPPADADNDGMADAWETARGLDPTYGNDHSQVMPSGYTAIEEYVNGLADALVQ